MHIRQHLVKAAATFFYIGYLPVAPGTCASLAAIVLFYLLRANPYAYILLAGIITLVGFGVCARAQEIYARKDARCIVIDEASGMLLALAFMPHDTKLIIAAFIIFRLFDIIKPYPVGKLENLKGSLGIMADDLASGLFTNIILQLFLRFASFKAA